MLFRSGVDVGQIADYVTDAVEELLDAADAAALGETVPEPV